MSTVEAFMDGQNVPRGQQYLVLAGIGPDGQPDLLSTNGTGGLLFASGAGGNALADSIELRRASVYSPIAGRDPQGNSRILNTDGQGRLLVVIAGSEDGGGNFSTDDQGNPLTLLNVGGANIIGALTMARLPGTAQSAATFGYRDNAADAANQVDSRLAGKTFAFTPLAGNVTANLFSAYNPVGQQFVRNPNAWCADLDLSCVSVWNSANADGTGGNRGCVTIVALQGTLAQALTNHHFAQPYQPGVQHVFVGRDGSLCTGTVVAGGGQAVYDDGSGTAAGRDIQVVYLQFVAPPALTPARLFGSGVAARAFPAGTPLLSFNQQKQAVVTEIDGHNPLDRSVGLRTATGAGRVSWSVVSDVPGYPTSPGRMGDSDSPSFVLTGGGLGLLTSYFTPSGGYSLGEFAPAINSLLPAGVSVGVVPVNLLGSASRREAYGPDDGPLLAIDPATKLIDPARIPPLPSNGANVEQVWDGTADVTIDPATTVFRGSFTALAAPRLVKISPAGQAGRRITLLLPRFAGPGGFGIAADFGSGGLSQIASFAASTALNVGLLTHYVLEYGSDGIIHLNDPTDGFDLAAVSGRRSFATLAYASSVALDFNTAYLQSLSLTGDVSLTALNVRIGRTILLCVRGDSVDRNVTWPGWRAMNAAPAVIPAGKWVEVRAICWGNNTAANVSARFTVQP